MKFSPAQGALALLIALPVCVQAAPPAQPAPATDVDLQAVGDRIRETGAQMQADLRKARARLEEQKAAERRRAAEQEAQRRREAEQEAQRQREADLARQRAAQEEAAARQKQAAVAQKKVKEEQAAKDRAAKALKQALGSGGEKAFEE